MSEAWRFWAEYSRKYFYGASDPNALRLLPYNPAIAKLLDSADDLTVATTDMLFEAEVLSPSASAKSEGSPKVVG